MTSVASGWMTVWKLIELKRFGKVQSRWWKQQYNRAISPRKTKMQNRGVEKGARGAKGNVWRREYHFRSDDPVDRQRPICVILCCVD